MGIVYDILINSILNHCRHATNTKLQSETLGHKLLKPNGGYVIYSHSIKYQRENEKALRYKCNGLYFISFKELCEQYNIRASKISFHSPERAIQSHFIVSFRHAKRIEERNIKIDDLPLDDDHLLYSFIDTRRFSTKTRRKFEPLVLKTYANYADIFKMSENPNGVSFNFITNKMRFQYCCIYYYDVTGYDDRIQWTHDIITVDNYPNYFTY